MGMGHLVQKPLAIDLFCGLGGWTEGLLAEGYHVVGFDIEQHAYGEHRYPAQLVIQDVLTLHGFQFKSAALIVASPPCQEFSYMAMPWKLAKAKAASIRADASGQMRADLTRLFDACFRIQREACEAAGHHIPMVVENVRGATPWVGQAQANYGSFFLWGDVPVPQPGLFDGEPRQSLIGKAAKVPGFRFDGSGRSFQTASVEGVKSPGLNWNDRRRKGQAFNPAAQGKAFREGVKHRGLGAAWFEKALDERRAAATAIKNGGDWFGAGDNCSAQCRASSGSTGRKAASAMIAKIPLPLSRHIAAVYHP